MQFQKMFKEKSGTVFWSQVWKEHDEVIDNAISALLAFGWTYLCEKDFCSMRRIKTKPRKFSLVVWVSTLSPWIQELMRKKQAYVSN